MSSGEGNRRTVAIVQARMGSTRLPGKVMRRLGSRTVLEQVLLRCEAVSGVDEVVCAVPLGSEDDPVAEVAQRAGFTVSRGPELDVLERYRRAAAETGAGVVLRVTSDCPLVDPDVCTAVLALRGETNADFACNNMPRTWPHGLDCEAFVASWLERAAREARQPAEREHVTPYIRTHPAASKVNLDGPGGVAAQQRWTLDTAADWRYLEAIFERIPDRTRPPSWSEVMALIEGDSRLEALAPVL